MTTHPQRPYLPDLGFTRSADGEPDAWRWEESDGDDRPPTVGEQLATLAGWGFAGLLVIVVAVLLMPYMGSA